MHNNSKHSYVQNASQLLSSHSNIFRRKIKAGQVMFCLILHIHSSLSQKCFCHIGHLPNFEYFPLKFKCTTSDIGKNAADMSDGFWVTLTSYEFATPHNFSITSQTWLTKDTWYLTLVFPFQHAIPDGVCHCQWRLSPALRHTTTAALRLYHQHSLPPAQWYRMVGFDRSKIAMQMSNSWPVGSILVAWRLTKS